MGRDDKALTKTQAAIQSAQDLLTAAHMEKQYHWHASSSHPTHLLSSHQLPSQRALAAAARARARLHAKWLQSHPWAAHLPRFSEAQGETLAAVGEGGHQVAEVHPWDTQFANAVLKAVGEGGQEGATEGATVHPWAPFRRVMALGAARLQGQTLQSQTLTAAAVHPWAKLSADSFATEPLQPLQPLQAGVPSPLEVAGGAGGAGAAGTAPAHLTPATHPPKALHRGVGIEAADLWGKKACGSGGCDMSKMLDMPPLVDEFNRSWVGDDTNRTWLDDMTGGHATGSSMKDAPFEEVGSAPGQWYVRRFDKETVPGWWETEPHDDDDGLIPGPHDRVYHGLEKNTMGQWKKEADGKGGFRWVFYAPWKAPKPLEENLSKRQGVGMWATEKRADGSVRWVWCGPEGMAGAEGDKSLDEYGEPRMAEGACHEVNLEQERLAYEKEQAKKAEEAKEEELAKEKKEVDEERKEVEKEKLREDETAEAAVSAAARQAEAFHANSTNEEGEVDIPAFLDPTESREAVDAHPRASKHDAYYLHPVITPANTTGGAGFWSRDANVFSGEARAEGEEDDAGQADMVAGEGVVAGGGDAAGGGEWRPVYGKNGQMVGETRAAEVEEERAREEEAGKEAELQEEKKEEQENKKEEVGMVEATPPPVTTPPPTGHIAWDMEDGEGILTLKILKSVCFSGFMQ